jgi:hypothetical protein
MEETYLNSLSVGSSHNVTRPHACATNHIFTCSHYKVNLGEGGQISHLESTAMNETYSPDHLN